jgi:hypothetical protein
MPRLALGIFAALIAHAAHGALVNCAALSANPGDYKVVLDDFAFASDPARNNADLAALKNRLQFSFNGQLDALRISAAKLDKNLQVPMRLIVCTGRQPSLTGEEFTDALAERLSDQRVVVEVWGTLDLAGSAGAAPAPRAMIGYAIPPVQQYVPANEVRPIQLLAYPKSGGARAIDELERLPELSAFALVGLGTKASRANRYDLAVWAFSRAETGIADSKLRGTNADLDSLLVYVKHAACLTRAGARTDPGYVGALRLVPAQNCTDKP